MMVIFLVGLVSMILMRTLRKDYARYSKEDDLDDMVIKYSFHFNFHLVLYASFTFLLPLALSPFSKLLVSTPEVSRMAQE